MPFKQMTQEQRDRRNERQRVLRAEIKAGTHVPRVFAEWRAKPDLSQLQRCPAGQAGRPVNLPVGSPRLLPVASAAATGRAACAGMDPRLFDSDSSPQDREKGKQACRSCDIRQACASTAQATGESFGIWGGTDLARPEPEQEAEAC